MFNKNKHVQLLLVSIIDSLTLGCYDPCSCLPSLDGCQSTTKVVTKKWYHFWTNSCIFHFSSELESYIWENFRQLQFFKVRNQPISRAKFQFLGFLHKRIWCYGTSSLAMGHSRWPLTQ